MAAVDAVLLDVGGVFYLPDPERIAAAARRHEIDLDPGRLVLAHYAASAALRGGLDGDDAIWEAYLRAYADSLGLPAGARDEAAAVIETEFATAAIWRYVVPGSVDALRALSATGVPLAIVSNNDGTAAVRLREDGICQVGPGPGVVVRAVIDSGEVGVAKPDPAIFRIALDALGVDPARTIHVGDTPAADVDGARAAGVRPVLVDPFDLCGDVGCARVRTLADVVPLVGG